MIEIPAPARELIEEGALAHLVTLNRDGSPQVSCVWVGLDAGELVVGSLGPRAKLDNVETDPRVAVSLEGTGRDRLNLQHYLVVYGRGRIQEGGAPELLQRLAHTYIGPGVKFPPMPDPPPGRVLRVAPERITGNGPWLSR